MKMPILTRSDPIRLPGWQQELGDAVRDPAELLEMLGLQPASTHGVPVSMSDFPLLVPRGFIARMRHGDPDDPLLRQVLPLGIEAVAHPDFHDDPVGDLRAIKAPGLLHKYHGRALLTLTGACAVHCRYCFRRHFPYAAEAAARDPGPALEYLARDTGITEVILSGGDPLTLSDRRLQDLVASIAAIAHVRRLRVHTRLPIVLPARITPGLVTALAGTRLACVVVIHVNHANEINGEVFESLARLRAAGMTLLNQSVLLRGVNDSADALVSLSEKLFEAAVLPYYLHCLDRVAGAAHFDVSDSVALTLMDAVRARLPGYLVPRLVREIEGAPYKTLIA